MKKTINRRDFMKIAGLAGGAGMLAACKTTPEATEAVEAVEEVVEAPASSRGGYDQLHRLGRHRGRPRA